MASSSTPSSSSIPAQKHHVFLSFRGEDTRNIFVGHLYKGLYQAGVRTFRDTENLEKGDLIPPQLLQAIEESSISIVILSENYANSSWCMDELGKIIECRDEKGQKVYPVFYDVEPSDVRKQQGNFGKGFDLLSSRFEQEPEKVKKWKLALEEVSKGGGFHLNKAQKKCEAEFIEKIINEVCETVGEIDLGDLPGLVGVQSRAEKVIKLLDLKSNDIHVLGIWGMGGIGKTTIADNVYNQIYWQFEASCYLESVKEVWREKGAKARQQQLIGDLSGGKDICFSRSSDGLHKIKNMVHQRKILIVLDDVDHSVEIEALIGKPEWFGKGSRIIITTQDKHLLTEYTAKHYKVELLNTVEALQLFRLKAFGENRQIEGFEELVNRALEYAGGLPLALKVLGSYLRGQVESVWKSELDRLKQYPEEKVQRILEISYDALKETEKQIFLDIACFFKGGNKGTVESILDGCGMYASSGISALVDKSLISISCGMIQMHQLIQEMGKNIVRKESKNPAKRSRLWDLEDLRCVLIENKETEAIESISVEVNEQEKLQLDAKAFTGMSRLRLLKIAISFIGMLRTGDVQLPEEFEYLPRTLRYLDWDEYPFKHMPSMFQPVHLVELNMERSNLERLWNVNMHLPMLKVMDLCFSKRLMECPDFSTTPNLEHLWLAGCTSLRDVHPSIGCLKKFIQLTFAGCHKLTSFPEIFGNLKCLESLILSETNITELPKSIGHLASLRELILSVCSNVTSVPDCFENMKCLNLLALHGLGMAELPTSILHLRGTNVLHLVECNLRWIPPDICLLHSLENLRLDGNDFESLPASMVQLSKLRMLFLDGCKRLQQLPELSSSLRILHADGCDSLRTIRNPLVYTRIQEFSFRNCSQLVESNRLREILILNPFRVSDDLIPNLEGFNITPGCEIPKWFSHQNRMGSSISFQLPLDFCNDKLLGLLVCFVFETTKETFAGTMEIQGWGKTRLVTYSKFTEMKHLERKASNKLETRHNVWLAAISYNQSLKCDASLTNGSEIKIQKPFGQGLKVKKCGAHLLYKDDPIFSSTFSSIKWKGKGRNKNNKARPSIGNCDEDFSTQQIMLDQHFYDNNMADVKTSAGTHPVGKHRVKRRVSCQRLLFPLKRLLYPPTFKRKAKKSKSKTKSLT